MLTAERALFCCLQDRYWLRDGPGAGLPMEDNSSAVEARFLQYREDMRQKACARDVTLAFAAPLSYCSSGSPSADSPSGRRPLRSRPGRSQDVCPQGEDVASHAVCARALDKFTPAQCEKAQAAIAGQLGGLQSEFQEKVCGCLGCCKEECYWPVTINDPDLV